MITNSANDTEGNTALGHNAGTALTYGGANILLGYQAGDALTTGSNNIVLGYDVDAPLRRDIAKLIRPGIATD